MWRTLSFRRNRAALRGLARRFAHNRRGVAAVEFAFVLPVMLTVYFGIVEVAQGVMIDRKITDLNRALADLTAQGTSISDTEMSNIFDAAQTIMAPFTSVAPKMAIVSVVIDSGGIAKVCWSAQRNSTVPKRGDTVTLPDNLKIASTSLIMATASYDFTPLVGYLVTGPITIGNTSIYMRPRVGKTGGTGNIEQVERASVAMCPLYN
ncbi:Flp pilus assembly protein TadG [Bosea sp. OK403]|jgi:Flp pilus assembly protein TadG|uniref:TadE/TadG family type IV pilus assembly protein n=1 Tax=Bosea sp. OK403 TaxID=1855286 RepID=UPI0008EBDF11|nr:TadE/TadG family type IV pilus assembly protein [Bosea sp. OK403]SFJ20596.1 Flp pilus assembly protein TadG [Bosea sp. OK403]